MGLGYLTKFIPACHEVFILSSILTIPAQVKTFYDYKKYISKEDKINVVNEDNNVNDTEQVISEREQKIIDLQKEKEFLLSSKEEDNEKIKTKKKSK